MITVFNVRLSFNAFSSDMYTTMSVLSRPQGFASNRADHSRYHHKSNLQIHIDLPSKYTLAIASSYVPASVERTKSSQMAINVD